MFVNVPESEQLENTALRLFFDGWERTVDLHLDFCSVYAVPIEEVAGKHDFSEEWTEYVDSAQAEMGAICAVIQQAAEIRLKSIICAVSPYLLLLNSEVPLKMTDADLDFTGLRTLDAVDLPRAVRTMTDFELPDSYIQQYGELRKRRNQVAHLGLHKGGLSPSLLIDFLCQQFLALWPDGRWLNRRVEFDGNSAQRFFHDGRYSSVETTVMIELPSTRALLDNETFKKVVGVSKSKLKGFCPNCVDSIARKTGIDPEATAYQTGELTAFCAMCENGLQIHNEPECCDRCEAGQFATSVSDATGTISVCYCCGCR
ncbi:hypothetical protein [Yoonia litorea]|uniref:Uncharacterized protein n=1 Tax=Yoonia litorea TaxID=1123755 RepID=A0A1I6MWL8_9RHOB|nr:hypothetical protein [Yoonia litorea]SFS20090.1 hypothetical protein SAMN05444714_2474 [Yoonia litorea]